MSIAEKMRSMREKSGLSVQEISDASGVPVSTINRILSGQTADPQFSTVAAIVTVMHGSLDDAAGIPHPMQDQSEMIDNLRTVIKVKERWLHRLFVFVAVLVGVLIIMVLADALASNIGYIRY